MLFGSPSLLSFQFFVIAFYTCYYSDGHVDDQKLSCPYEPVSVYYRLNKENPEVTCDPWLARYSLISEHTHVYVLFNTKLIILFSWAFN